MAFSLIKNYREEYTIEYRRKAEQKKKKKETCTHSKIEKLNKIVVIHSRQAVILVFLLGVLLFLFSLCW